MTSDKNAMSWKELARFADKECDRTNGANNSYSCLRLFNKDETEIRVTLYRDHHAWCPYCQKVWLWLEFKNIPYRVKKVTMRCYGEKESWYTRKVPSGMLPAIEIDSQIITESDDILFVLEKEYGPLGRSLNDPNILELRRLERELFRSWCQWLCYKSIFPNQENENKNKFQSVAKKLEKKLVCSHTPFLDMTTNSQGNQIPGVGDVIYIPYLERMNASLAYYKGFCLRKEYPSINEWFQALEQLHEYRGTQGDFHTHAHDLPPQMGGCWADYNNTQKEISKMIDSGQGLGQQEINIPSLDESLRMEYIALALTRVIKHKQTIISTNPMGEDLFDQPLRSALTNMVSKKISCTPEKGSASGLRYLRDRISVPRDMPLLSARELRLALESTAQKDGEEQGPKIPTRNRFDQDPKPFL